MRRRLRGKIALAQPAARFDQFALLQFRLAQISRKFPLRDTLSEQFAQSDFGSQPIAVVERRLCLLQRRQGRRTIRTGGQGRQYQRQREEPRRHFRPACRIA